MLGTYPWDASGQGADPLGELLEAGYRHGYTHVVLKPECVRRWCNSKFSFFQLHCLNCNGHPAKSFK